LRPRTREEKSCGKGKNLECGDLSPLLKALTSQRTPKLLLKTQNPVTFLPREDDRWQRDLWKIPGAA
jgi:hypothetical protein